MLAEDVETFLGVGKGQQVVQVIPSDRGPSQMLGYQHRLYALDQGHQSAEMNAVELLRVAQRERNPVNAHGVVATQFDKAAQSSRFSHVVLRMHLKEAQ